MRLLRRAGLRYALIAAGVFLAVGVLTPPAVSAQASTTNSADLAVTMSPASERLTNFGPGSGAFHFLFHAVVTNNGPYAASQVVVTVPGGDSKYQSVGFSVSPSETCITSGGTFSCVKIPVGGTVTANIEFTDPFCFGYACAGAVTATASSATPDPNAANNSASGTWEVVCFTRRNCY
jgi:hypothetical protein